MPFIRKGLTITYWPRPSDRAGKIKVIFQLHDMWKNTKQCLQPLCVRFLIFEIHSFTNSLTELPTAYARLYTRATDSSVCRMDTDLNLFLATSKPWRWPWTLSCPFPLHLKKSHMALPLHCITPGLHSEDSSQKSVSDLSRIWNQFASHLKYNPLPGRAWLGGSAST